MRSFHLTRLTRGRAGILVTSAFALIALAACWPYYESYYDSFDEDADCIDVCDRIDDCINDNDFDTTDCIDDCSSRSFDSSSYEDDVDDCSACIDDTCSEARECGSECAGIVDVDLIDVDVVIID